MISPREARQIRRENYRQEQEIEELKKFKPEKNKAFDRAKRTIFEHDYESEGLNDLKQENFVIDNDCIKVYKDIPSIIVKLLEDPQLKEFHANSPWFSNTLILDAIKNFQDRKEDNIVKIKTANPSADKKFKGNYQVSKRNLPVEYTPCINNAQNMVHSKVFLFKYKNGDIIHSTGSFNVSQNATKNQEELFFNKSKDMWESSYNRYIK